MSANGNDFCQHLSEEQGQEPQTYFSRSQLEHLRSSAILTTGDIVPYLGQKLAIFRQHITESTRKVLRHLHLQAEE